MTSLNVCPCTLHTGATSQYTSASSMPFLTLFYKTNWTHSRKLWLTLASTTLWTSLFCMVQVQPKSQLLKTFPLCNDCKKKTVTKSLGKCCTAWTSTFLIPKIPVSTFSMPFPCLFDLNTHAEYVLPQTGLLPIKWQSIGFVTALPKDGLFLLISTNEKS